MTKRGEKMKRIISLRKKSAVSLFLVLAVSLTLSCQAMCENKADVVSGWENPCFNWYCRHTKGEKIPDIDPSMSFIEDHNGVYIDKSANDDNKTIYLTFDAGYENGNVERILDILKAKEVKGSFFILENLAERNGELVRRMAEEGHLICNHTATHRDMTTSSSIEEFQNELDRLNESVKTKCNVEVSKFYRPPEGRFSIQNLEWAESLGYKTVFWSFAYADWDNNKQPSPSSSLKKLLDGAHPGEILLLHPTSATNAAILADFIDALSARGYVFKTIDELPS